METNRRRDNDTGDLTSMSRLSGPIFRWGRGVLLVMPFLAQTVWAAERQSKTSEQHALSARLPNVHFTFTQRPIAFLLEREIRQSSPVRAVVMRTDVRGQAHTHGRLSASFSPNPNRGLIALNLDASVRANTVGRRGPITARSVTLSRVSATKKMYFTLDGIGAFPATATASTGTACTRVEARSGLIKRFAQRRVDRMQPETASMASCRAQQQAKQELDQQVQEQIGKANRFYRDELLTGAVGREILPSALRTYSTSDRFHINALLAAPSQSAAPSNPPSLQHPHDVQLAFHESMANNLAETVLGGSEVQDKDFARFLQNIFGDVPRQYRLGTHMESWSVRLAEHRPIAVHIDQELIKVSITCVDFTRGARQIHYPVTAAAQYRPGITRFGLNLRRDGEVSYVRPSGEGNLTNDEEMFAFVKKKFDALLAVDVYFQGLVPPPGGAWDKLSQFKIHEILADGEWFAIGIDLLEGETR